MDPQIQKRYNETILQAAMQRYSIETGKIQPIDAFESFIYQFERDGGAYILRIGHNLRKSQALILGEMDWINYLAAGGVSVPQAIRSDAGEWVECVDDGQGGQFLVTAFVKSPGESPWRAGWTPQVFEQYGRMLGRMHALTKDYQPPDPAWRRPEWDGEVFEFVESYLPDSQLLVKQKYRDALAEARQLPKDRDTYGLIHQDAHGANLLLDEAGNLTLIDFDDCGYSWFINDIAIVAFYALVTPDDRPATPGEFMTHFLRGYRQANRLDPIWLKQIPLFLKVREIELYAVVHRDVDMENIDNPWIQEFMLGRREMIEQDKPVVDFDFESLVGEM